MSHPSTFPVTPPRAAISIARRELLLFFCVVWFCYGLFISVVDLEFYTLQQAGVEAIVEHGTYRLGLSSVELLQPRGDVFTFNGYILAAKQPGQFTLAALPYFVFSRFGITYASNYDLAAALVTWCSATLLSALGCLCFHLLVRQVWGLRTNVAYALTLLYGFGTILFPYAGVLHHDTIAAAYLMISFYLLEKVSTQQSARPLLLTSVAGVLVGLTIFTSMLPAPVVVVFTFYLLFSKNIMRILGYFAGVVIGLLPLFAYNLHYFGGIWTQANVAGDFADTFIRLDWTTFTQNLWTYLGWGDLSVYKYMPILVVAWVGAWLFPAHLRRQQFLLISAPLFQVAYILNIGTIGHCQYGPRYLIPVVPFVMAGLAGWFLRQEVSWISHSRLALLELAGGYSLLINLVGAISGTPFCGTQDFTVLKILETFVIQGVGVGIGPFPLWPACLAALALLGIGVAMQRRVDATDQ